MRAAHESQTPQLDELSKFCESNNKVLHNDESNDQMLSYAIPIWVTSQPFKDLHYTSYNIQRTVLQIFNTNGSLVRQRTCTRNTNNLIVIDCLQSGGSVRSTQGHKTPSKVPKLTLSNVTSLVPKLDEVRDFLHCQEINLAFITETWLIRVNI